MSQEVAPAVHGLHDAWMGALRYRLVVEGELGERYARAFDGMDVCSANGETEIMGPVVDQSQLLGLLERIAGLGLTIRSVSSLGEDAAS